MTGGNSGPLLWLGESTELCSTWTGEGPFPPTGTGSVGVWCSGKSSEEKFTHVLRYRWARAPLWLCHFSPLHFSPAHFLPSHSLPNHSSPSRRNTPSAPVRCRTSSRAQLVRACPGRRCARRLLRLRGRDRGSNRRCGSRRDCVR